MIWLGKSPQQYAVGEPFMIGPFQYTLSWAPTGDIDRYTLYNITSDNGLIFHYLGVNPSRAKDYLEKKGFKDVSQAGLNTISARKQETMAIIQFLRQECHGKALQK